MAAQFSQYSTQGQPEHMVSSVASSQFASQSAQSGHGASVVYASPTKSTEPSSHVTSTPANQRQQQPPSVSVTPIHRDPRDVQVGLVHAFLCSY